MTEYASDALSHRKATPRQRATISAWLRDRENFEIDTTKIDSLLALTAPAPVERAMRLLEHLASRHDVGVAFDVGLEDPALLGAASAVDRGELRFLLVDLLLDEQKALIALAPDLVHINASKYRISPHGWNLVQQRRSKAPDSASVFIAMWFDDSMNPLRDEVLEPAVRAAGYEPKLVNRHEHANRIDDEIVALIRQSRFVVADFTGNRGGVYFEAGFALGLGRRVIWTCRADHLDPKGDQHVHFDVSHFNFIEWNESTLAKAKQRLEARILALEGRGPLGSAQ